MSNIYICNASTDDISKISIDDLKEINRIKLRSVNGEKRRPRAITRYDGNLLVCNSFSNDISIINEVNNKEESYFIGMNCNDVKVYKNLAYIVCGDINRVIVFDLCKKQLSFSIPCGDYPYSISINEKKDVFAVSNMYSNTVGLYSLKYNNLIEEVNVGEYPTKVLFSRDGRQLFFCESFLGADLVGNLCSINLNTKHIQRVNVGYAPLNLYSNSDYVFCTNYDEESISVVELSTFEEKNKLYFEGVPSAVIYYNSSLFVTDSENARLIKINMENEKEKAIPIGEEPIEMTLF